MPVVQMIQVTFNDSILTGYLQGTTCSVYFEHAVSQVFVLPSALWRPVLGFMEIPWGPMGIVKPGPRSPGTIGILEKINSPRFLECPKFSSFMSVVSPKFTSRMFMESMKFNAPMFLKSGQSNSFCFSWKRRDSIPLCSWTPEIQFLFVFGSPKFNSPMFLESSKIELSYIFGIPEIQFPHLFGIPEIQ